MIEPTAWILLVQLWTEPPPQIKFVYKKEYPNYEECMAARDEWEKKNLIAICSIKVNKESNKK
jgi:hypothetical protein